VRVGLARERNGSPPQVVAQLVARALTPRPRSRYLVGKDSRRMALVAGLPTPCSTPCAARSATSLLRDRGLCPRQLAGRWSPRRWRPRLRAQRGCGRNRIRSHDTRKWDENMTITLPAFTPMEESLFLTQCGRTLDSRSSHPILADTMAAEVARKLGYDCGGFHLSASPILNIALRAKKLDDIALRFVTRHPDAVGLDLGAGLDTRVFRIAPPPTSTGTTSTSPT
jgi:hypothetical protein